MYEYDYRGYTILECDGYFYAGDHTFCSFDEAMDWVDGCLEVDENGDFTALLNTYHIYYVTKSYDRGYDEFIKARNEDDAIRKLRRKHKDIAYIADCCKVGE